jgi:hypothetical protein
LFLKIIKQGRIVLLDERFMVFQGKALDHFGGYSKAMDVYEDLEVINSDLHI